MGEHFHKRRSKPGKTDNFDYKDLDMLFQYITPGGKIIPARMSRLSAKQQRQLAAAVKRARQLALVPVGSY